MFQKRKSSMSTIMSIHNIIHQIMEENIHCILLNNYYLLDIMKYILVRLHVYIIKYPGKLVLVIPCQINQWSKS